MAHSAIDNALLSLDGLSVGDAFGELFFRLSPDRTRSADLPAGPWRWTDDTHMALSIVEVLRAHGRIDQAALAQAFARRYVQEPWRGYAGGAKSLLEQVANGADWRAIAPYLFGSGSYGNGGAMRVAPLGAYFADDLPRAAREAALSAEVTHAHPEGQAGAIAVAVAAALAASQPHPVGVELLDAVLPYVPAGVTAERLRQARSIQPDDLSGAVRQLGSGREVSAQDTAPFCLWCAAHHSEDYEEALWWTVRGRGDCDTTCAIVGGIVALSARAVPAGWLARREPLGR